MHSCQVGDMRVQEDKTGLALHLHVMDLNHLHINQDTSTSATPLETELLPSQLVFSSLFLAQRKNVFEYICQNVN